MKGSQVGRRHRRRGRDVTIVPTGTALDERPGAKQSLQVI